MALDSLLTVWVSLLRPSLVNCKRDKNSIVGQKKQTDLRKPNSSHHEYDFG